MISDHWAKDCQHEERRWTRFHATSRDTGKRLSDFAVVEQCALCGARLETAKKAQFRDPEALPEFDYELRERVSAERVAGLSPPPPQARQRYEEYLRSATWRAKRELVFARCNGACEGCADAPAFEVHHLTYKHLGDELLFELVGLCVTCHQRVHGEPR